MKRLRLEQWPSQLLRVRPSAPLNFSPSRCNSRPLRPARPWSVRRQQSTAAFAAGNPDVVYEAEAGDHAEAADGRVHSLSPLSYPSPAPEEALASAKLAALHARIGLPRKVPVQSLARALVDASADENSSFNNANLAYLGQSLINYHVTEWIMCRYPRLPMSIVYSGISAYAGAKPLYQIARSWGVESAAAPGGEVDPGLLQFSTTKPPAKHLAPLGYERTEAAYLDKFKWRRGINSRIVLDDDFGERVETTPEGEQANLGALDEERDLVRSYGTDMMRKLAEDAHANFVRGVVGALYAHCGLEVAKTFIKAHVLSRTLDFAGMFSFKLPTRELALLCARESFEKPVARLLSETGRLSRTPVFVVGIYSGKDKLAEGAGPNLDAARWKAAMNALMAWYLYSPGENVRVPSDMLVEGAKPWDAAHIDIGEITVV